MEIVLGVVIQVNALTTGDPTMDKLAAQVDDAKEEILRVLPRQPRWKRIHLHDTASKGRWNGAIMSCASFALMEEDKLYFDDHYWVREGPNPKGPWQEY